jgi:hypothetical protein
VGTLLDESGESRAEVVVHDLAVGSLGLKV